MKRQHILVVAVVTVIALVLGFAVGMLAGSDSGSDDAVAPSTVVTTTPAATVPPGTESPATVTPANEAPDSTQPPPADAPTDETAAPSTEAPLTEGPDGVTPTESAGGPLAGSFGDPAEIVPQGEAFVAEFATPEDFYDRFNWDWGMRPDPRTFDVPAEGLTAQADHSEHGGADGACGPPTETRTVELRDPDQQVYWCGPKGPESGHIMTATPFTGYGILTFSPKQSFTDISKVCWDQNLTFLDGRRWTNMLVIPEDVYQANAPRLDYASPSFGPGFEVGGLNLDTPETARTLKVFMGATFWHPSHDGPEVGNNGGAVFDNDDRATRYTHCIEDLGDGTVRVTQERPEGGELVDVWPGDLPDGEVRVLFQDDRYDTAFEDTPITWHWDNITIS